MTAQGDWYTHQHQCTRCHDYDDKDIRSYPCPTGWEILKRYEREANGIAEEQPQEEGHAPI